MVWNYVANNPVSAMWTGHKMADCESGRVKLRSRNRSGKGI